MVLGTRDTANPYSTTTGNRALEKRDGCQSSGKDALLLRLQFTANQDRPSRDCTVQLKSFPTFVFDFSAILVSHRNMYFGETSWGSGLTIYPSQTENAKP